MNNNIPTNNDLTPFFSIGVTTFDRSELLVETIRSICSQTFSDFEVLIGNDNPARSITADALGINDSRIRYLNYNSNLGELRNMNHLLELSYGRYFTWLADDDLYAPDFLGAMYRALVWLDHPVCVFTSFTEEYELLNQNKEIKEQAQIFTGRQFLEKFLSRDIKAHGCCGIFNVDYLKKIGGMRQLGQGHSPYSDTLLAIQAGLLNKVGYINSPLMFYRDHGGSISSISKDLIAYKTAQEDLCAQCVDIFNHESLRDNFEISLYELLTFWCIEQFCVVVIRNGKIPLQILKDYLLFIRKYAKLLGNYKYKMYSVSLSKALYFIAVFFKRYLIHLSKK